MKVLQHRWLRAAGLVTMAVGAAAAVQAQEVTGQKSGGAATMKAIDVSQQMLSGAGGQSANWLHTNGDYAQTALLPRLADQHRQRQEPEACVRVADRGRRVDGNGADRRRRRDVPDHLVQPHLRHRRGDRPGVLALQAQDGSGDDVLLRPEQPRRRDLRRARSSWARSMRAWSRSTPRPATCCGTCRSPTPKRATARRWRRRWSTTRC